MDGVIRNSESQAVMLDEKINSFKKQRSSNRKPINVNSSNNSGIQFGNEERSSSSNGAVNFDNNANWTQNNSFKITITPHRA